MYLREGNMVRAKKFETELDYCDLVTLINSTPNWDMPEEERQPYIEAVERANLKEK